MCLVESSSCSANRGMPSVHLRWTLSASVLSEQRPNSVISVLAHEALLIQSREFFLTGGQLSFSRSAIPQAVHGWGWIILITHCALPTSHGQVQRPQTNRKSPFKCGRSSARSLALRSLRGWQNCAISRDFSVRWRSSVLRSWASTPHSWAGHVLLRPCILTWWR